MTLQHISPASTSLISLQLKASPLLHIFLGAVATGGGGGLAGTLNVWSSNWSFGTPVFLRDGVGIWSLLDFWGGALIGVSQFPP
jgi:hypothetical protein